MKYTAIIIVALGVMFGLSAQAAPQISATQIVPAQTSETRANQNVSYRYYGHYRPYFYRPYYGYYRPYYYGYYRPYFYGFYRPYYGYYHPYYRGYYRHHW